MREDLIHLDRLDAQTRFLGENKIESIDDLNSFRTEAEDKLISLSNMRNLLRNELKRVTRAVDTEGIQRVKGRIAEVSEEMRKIRKQVRLCDGIEERSVSMADELQRLSEEPAREEEKNNEQLFRGRSGASRPHEPRGS